MADVSQLGVGQSIFGWPAGVPSVQTHTISASNIAVGFILQAKNANPITHLGVRYGLRIGGTPPTYVATLETVDTSTGLPSGTDIGGGSPTAVTFNPPADASINNLWQWYQLTNAYTPTRGQLIAGTIRYSSGTIDIGNCSSFTSHVANMLGGVRISFPYGLRMTSGTWSPQIAMGVGGFRTASERYGYIFEGTSQTRTASTVGHRQALKFRLPSGMCSTYTIRGIRLCGSIANATGKAPVIKLWNSAGTVLQSYTADSDQVISPTATWQTYHYTFADTSLATLSSGTDYRVGLEVADATNGGVMINTLTYSSVDDMAALPFGSNWYFSTYDGSSWTDSTMERPFIELLLGDVTGGSGTAAVNGVFFGGSRS